MTQAKIRDNKRIKKIQQKKKQEQNIVTTNKKGDYHSSERKKNLVDSKNHQNLFRKFNAPAELVERRTKEHQVEWCGLKSNFEPYILYFFNCNQAILQPSKDLIKAKVF